MAKLWLLSWTLAMPTLPVLERSLRAGSPLFHIIHQLESTASDWVGFFFVVVVHLFLFFFFTFKAVVYWKKCYVALWSLSHRASYSS